jgi:RNA polymerase sigma factor (sigma-70 family)
VDNLNRDQPSINQVYNRYYASLLQYGTSIGVDKALVEDAIQDLFTQFCEHSHTIDHALDKEAYLKVALKRNILKKVKDSSRSEATEAKLLEISVPSFEDVLIAQQSTVTESMYLEQLLASLSASQKTIVTLRFYKNMTYDDIAEKLNINKRTVYNQVHDAMVKMRKIIK